MTAVVGIDCATQPNLTGIALGVIHGDSMRIEKAVCASRDRSPAAIVSEWVLPHDRALLAIDAPLGWPAPLATALSGHRAGDPLSSQPNAMFRRRTDDAICARLGKRSLDVGADKIARTAHAALTLLDELRRSLEIPIELAWNPNSLGRVAAIEVYPAATRLAHGVAAGVDWITRLPDRVVTTIDPLPESLDAQDAIVCVLAGFDFLRGKAVGPTFLESEKARSEGWIWARAR